MTSRLMPLLLLAPLVLPAQSNPAEWPIHSMDRARPPVVHPAGPVLLQPPADAVVLFDGRSLDAWRRSGDEVRPAGWRLVEGGAMEVVPGSGSIETVEHFGDVQLHVEWRTASPPRGEGQDRSNSGVFLMGRYEVQVLDSWESITYADGQAGSIYGQYPPLVNASLPPGSWQSYDIIFRRPRFDEAGQLTVPARMTVFHNGILVHEDAVLIGPTSHRVRAPYEAHPDRQPIGLQDHGELVRFRNIWVRPLSDQP